MSSGPRDVMARWLRREVAKYLQRISLMGEEVPEEKLIATVHQAAMTIGSYSALPDFPTTREEFTEQLITSIRVNVDIDVLRPAVENAWDMGASSALAPSKANMIASTSWTGELAKDAKGKALATTANVIMILRNDPAWVHAGLAFDSMLLKPVSTTGRLPIDLDLAKLSSYEVRPGIIRRHVDRQEDFVMPIRIEHTAIVGQIMCALQTKYGMAASSQQMIGHALVTAAYARQTDCFAEWAERQVWDGTHRLINARDGYFTGEPSEFAMLFTDDKDYALRVITPFLRIFMLSWVARIYSPGTKVDTMLVLEGKQGLGKSTAFESLCPHPSFYRSGHLKMGDKDVLQLGIGAAMVELSELDRMLLSPRIAVEVKSWQRQAKDDVRLPYAAEPIEILRRFCVYGTVNRFGAWLADIGFQRAYMPIRVSKRVDTRWIQRHRGQLIAEAREMLLGGWEHYPTEEETNLINDEMQSRILPDSLAEIIKETLLSYGCCFITTSEVATILLGISPVELPKMNSKITEAMLALGWMSSSHKRRAMKHKTPGWLAPDDWPRPIGFADLYEAPRKGRYFGKNQGKKTLTEDDVHDTVAAVIDLDSRR